MAGSGVEPQTGDVDQAGADEQEDIAETDATAIGEVESAPDSRAARPEPFEHAFGAQTHPAEPAPGESNPGGTALSQPTEEPRRPETTPADPSATPEQ